MIKDEEMKGSSDLFFGFFTTLIKNVHRSMPKIEEKKDRPKKKVIIKDKKKGKGLLAEDDEGQKKSKTFKPKRRGDNDLDLF